jgi:hypothetical protein
MSLTNNDGEVRPVRAGIAAQLLGVGEETEFLDHVWHRPNNETWLDDPDMECLAQMARGAYSTLYFQWRGPLHKGAPV